jgi:hypothetical protein
MVRCCEASTESRFPTKVPTGSPGTPSVPSNGRRGWLGDGHRGPGIRPRGKDPQLADSPRPIGIREQEHGGFDLCVDIVPLLSGPTLVSVKGYLTTSSPRSTSAAASLPVDFIRGASPLVAGVVVSS